MTQIASNYAHVLYDMGISKEIMEETKRIFTLTTELLDCLNSPIVPRKEKHAVISLVFPKEMHPILQYMCDHNSISLFQEVYGGYDKIDQERHGSLKATLYYVSEPTKRQKEQFMHFLATKYKKKSVYLLLKECPELLAGFVLRIGDEEIDWSIKGRFEQLQQKLIRR